SQPIGSDERARLVHMRAEDVAKRVVEDMGRGMVQHRRIAADPIHPQPHARSGAEFLRGALEASSEMNDGAVGLSRVRDLRDRSRFGLDNAAVADLASALRV